MRSFGRAIVGLLVAGFSIGSGGAALAQSSASETALPPPVTFTADQDHQNMMDQLGIKALRPGPSGDEKAPNHANYDEAKANPFPNLPDPLTLNNGQKVTTPAMWWDKRRPEIVDMYEKYVYGRVPGNVPRVSWTVTAVDHELIGFRPVIVKDLIGHVDNSSYPLINVNIHMTLVTPANAKGPVPVLMMFGRAGFPAPNEPVGADMERINKALKTLLIQQDPSLKEVFETASGVAAGKEHAVSAPAAQRRWRTAQYLATDCRRLGLRALRSCQRAGRRRGRYYARHHWPREQRSAAPSRRLGSVARVGVGRRTWP